jgi:L,D-transpeptidase ErfK/SrfK
MRERFGVMMRVVVVVAGVWGLAPGAVADTYLLPGNGDNIVGSIALATTNYEDTLPDIGYAYDQGHEDMRLANPKVDVWLPGQGTEVLIPSQYVLPDTPREGVVINLPELRLYYYPKTKAGQPRVVMTFPVSIGPQDWRTPQGLTSIIAKKRNPSWTPPASIRAEHERDGETLPKVIPAGPDNPLGEYALSLGKSGYLIHGTNKPFGVGMRVTHGCLRLYPKDIERLFGEVSVGTPVRIINQPFKVGRLNGALYVETHPPLEEDGAGARDGFTQLNGLVVRAAESAGQTVDWDQLQKVVQEQSGVPTAVSAVAEAAL